MFSAGIRLGSSLALAAGEIAFDSARAICGDDVVDIRPRQFRRLLLTFEDSIHGRIPEILGDDESERIDTLVSLLRGTSEQDLSKLISALQQALRRLDEEKCSGGAPGH
jgi:hypothetical protein